MRTTIAAAAIAAILMAPGAEARAQGFLNRNRQATTPAAPAPLDPYASRAGVARETIPPPSSATAPRDKAVLKNNSEIPAPLPIEDSKPVMPLPTGPIEPYMLTKENGPFMVLAYSFKGPDAPRQALALVLELRNKEHLPAYILLPKKFPGKSNIRGVPPQAPVFAMRDDVGLPELIRTLDEAAVLVGDEKTVKDATDLMKRVKKLHPVCIDGQPQMWQVRHGIGLSRAIRTTNPLVPAEDLFPRQPDVMIAKINGGPHSIRYCNGRYTLPIATFSGRSTFDEKNDPRFMGFMPERKSPLVSAADDAERLAEALSHDPDIQKTGYQPYVYHDRYSSRVMIGSFDSPNDPAARQLHDRMVELVYKLAERKVTETMIVPAPALLDLAQIKTDFAQVPTTGQARK